MKFLKRKPLSERVEDEKNKLVMMRLQTEELNQKAKVKEAKLAYLDPERRRLRA